MYKNCSQCQKQIYTQHVLSRFELGIFMYWTCNSMNNLSSYVLWVSWCKNKSFWQRFACILYDVKSFSFLLIMPVLLATILKLKCLTFLMLKVQEVSWTNFALLTWLLSFLICFNFQSFQIYQFSQVQVCKFS